MDIDQNGSRGERMSVLIKGMKMPKSCKSCDLLQDYDGDMYCPLDDDLNFGDIEDVPDYVMIGCRLVELPETHGRLIDADALKLRVQGDPKVVACIVEWIDQQPTIIPAEEGE